jgi:hypothetical protein
LTTINPRAQVADSHTGLDGDDHPLLQSKEKDTGKKKKKIRGG